MRIVVVLSLLGLFFGLAVGHGDEEDTTVSLTKDTFAEEIAASNYFVMFFAPWCGHCQRLAPTWSQLAEMLNSKEASRVRIGKVDCTVESDLCSKHEVTGYPTLKFFKVDSDEAVKFRGTRDLPSLSNFINEQLGEDDGESDGAEGEDGEVAAKPVGGLVELTDVTFGKHVTSGKHFVKFYAPWCGHCQKLAPTWEELGKSLEHDDSVSIAKIDCTQFRPICQDFEVKGYPTLLWIEDGKKVEKYSGPRTHEDLKAYVDRMAGKQQKAADESNNTVEEEPQQQQMVIQLTGGDFDRATEKGVTFVKFYAPWCGHCKRLAPTWDQLAVKFVGQTGIQIAKVDCTLADNKELCSQQEVNGFPTLFIYKDGAKISEYEGNRNLQDLYDFVVKHMPSSRDEL